MTKSELIKIVHDRTNYKYTEIEEMTNLIFSAICEGLEKDGKVVISGFGTFEKYYQDGYTGINPSTGLPILVQGSNKVRFNASKKIKNELNKK